MSEKSYSNNFWELRRVGNRAKHRVQSRTVDIFGSAPHTHPANLPFTTSRSVLFFSCLPLMAVIRRLVVSPPLMNSSSPWASEQNQLQELFDSPHTGAVTTRTATLTGFGETSEHTVCPLCLSPLRSSLTRLGGCLYK